MELLLHYCWKHRLFPQTELCTTDHRRLEVIDPGLHNRNAGPDFFNAKVKVDGTLWVGNVEIHDKASDWYHHEHDRDAAYDNVVLHVVGRADVEEVRTSSGNLLPQVEISVPQSISEHYDELIGTDHYPPCYKLIPSLTRLMMHSWLSALQTERLEQKTMAIEQRVKQCDGSWETAYFVTRARTFGFGVNGDAFEAWAMNMPLRALDHHRDDAFQIEAIMMGQAGLLETEALHERYAPAALEEGYFERLRNEYRYLAHKFGLSPIDYKRWKFLRMHPQNFPHIRIAQLVALYTTNRTGLSQLLDCATAKDLYQLFNVGVTPYWQPHYSFGHPSRRNAKHLSPASRRGLFINTVIPMLFAYGRHLGDEKLCDRAFDFLEQLEPENNHIVRMWEECGLHVDNAGDSQALLQLKRMYCDRKDCLRCRIGYEYLKKDRT